jgi:hypothetical protein
VAPMNPLVNNNYIFQNKYVSPSELGQAPAPGQPDEALTDGEPSQVVSIERSRLNGLGGIPSPSLLGNKSINLSYDKPAGFLKRREDFQPVSFGSYLPAYQPDNPIISCLTVRWGTRKDEENLQKSSFSLPGTGEITSLEDCGTWLKLAACSREPVHYKKKIAHNCGHTECSICWSGAIGRIARGVSSRIRGFRKDAVTKDLYSDSQLIVNHFSLSPPSGVITPDMSYDKIKQKGRSMAEKAGIWGGFMAFHPFRLKKRIKQRLTALCAGAVRLSEEEKEKKFWQLVKEDTLHLGSWQDYVRWSPHYHAAAFGWLPSQETDEQKEAVKKLYKGWVVTWIRHVETYQQFDGTRLCDPIAELAFYVLSHAGYQPGKKIPVWLGACSQNKMHVEETLIQEFKVVCPKCAAPVVVGGEDQDGVFVPDPGDGMIYNSDGHLVPDGEFKQYILKCREKRYVIGKSQKSDWRKEYREIIEKARLERLAMGIT